MQTIQITFNGSKISAESGDTLATLLNKLNINSRNAVVECNGKIILPEDRSAIILKEGDDIQAFSMVGGG